MNQQAGKINVSATAACLAMVAFWTIGPIAIKLLSGYLDLWMQNLLRYTAAAIFWLPFLILSCRQKTLDNKIWAKAIWPATANITLQCFWAMSFYYLDPAFAILLTKSSVIWICSFSLLFFADERVLLTSSRFWSGLVLCTVGVIGVMVFHEDFGAKKTLTGIILVLIASFCWSVYTILSKIFFKGIDSRACFSVTSIYTVAGLGILAAIFGNPGQCVEMGLRPWVYVVVSGIACIAFTHVLYYAAMKRIGATIPTLVLLLTPFTVLAVSSIVFGESLNMAQWIFGAILLAGATLAIWAQGHLNKL
jgi:drug/metabolite transporter (DMT)-like permease